MAMRFSEAIRRWMGWCPDAAAAGAGRRYAVPDGESGVGMADSDRQVVGDALVDYGPIGTPARCLILLVAGALLIGGLTMAAPAGRFLLLAIMLAYSGMELYGAVRRARIEITSDKIIIRRPLFRPVVIPKDAVVKAEVRENKLPVPSWLLAVALAALLVSAAGSIYTGLDNPASMRFISGVAAVIFFPAIFYRTYVRTHYLRTLTITTAEKRIAAIYMNDPERIARALEGF